MKNKNLKIRILIGIPASGKSFWATNFLRNNPNWVRVNRDSFRLMLRNEQMCEPKIEDLVSDILIKATHSALQKKLNVIIDNTNIKEKYIRQFIEEFKYSADIEYQVFDISIDKALERNKNREASVGEDVIKRMYKDYKFLMDTFDFEPVWKTDDSPHILPNFKNPLPDCIIFDIDGTLALKGKRNVYDLDKVFLDDINPLIAEQTKFHKSIGRKIIIVSGREDVCKDETEEWLDFYGIERDELFMRKKDDFRKDTVIKKEIYDNHIKEKYNVIAVYDDRLNVIDMWYKEGIFTFNVNQGNIEF
jgi:predicted kinase